MFLHVFSLCQKISWLRFLPKEVMPKLVDFQHLADVFSDGQRSHCRSFSSSQRVDPVFLCHEVRPFGRGNKPTQGTYDHHGYLGGGNSKIFYFHPEPWGNDCHFDYVIFFRWVETTNQCFFLVAVITKGFKYSTYNGGILTCINYLSWMDTASVRETHLQNCLKFLVT